MTATVSVDKRGRIILTDSGGEVWLVLEPNEHGDPLRNGPFAFADDSDRILFYSERGLFTFSPAPVRWRDLAAHELETLLHVATLVPHRA